MNAAQRQVSEARRARRFVLAGLRAPLNDAREGAAEAARAEEQEHETHAWTGGRHASRHAAELRILAASDGSPWACYRCGTWEVPALYPDPAYRAMLRERRWCGRCAAFALSLSLPAVARPLRGQSVYRDAVYLGELPRLAPPGQEPAPRDRPQPVRYTVKQKPKARKGWTPETREQAAERARAAHAARVAAQSSSTPAVQAGEEHSGEGEQADPVVGHVETPAPESDAFGFLFGAD